MPGKRRLLVESFVFFFFEAYVALLAFRPSPVPQAVSVLVNPVWGTVGTR